MGSVENGLLIIKNSWIKIREKSNRHCFWSPSKKRSIFKSINKYFPSIKSWKNRSWILQDDLQCLGFAEDFYNYTSCYERNRNNKDFFEKEWRVYFDPRSDLDKADRKPLPQIFRTRFEKIRLEDENGLLVNEYKFY
jgi:hypothetical protein